jgi:hypothetical protein
MRPLALVGVTASTRCTDRAQPFVLNQTVYRVMNNFGSLGFFDEIDGDRADLEAAITRLGQQRWLVQHHRS